MFLLDTHVISETRKPRPHGGVLAWLRQAPDNGLYLSAVSIGEIQKGIELTRAPNPQRAGELQAWLDEVMLAFPILPADGNVFQRWARLMHGQPDHHAEDALIAATALLHGLTVVTRNTQDFKPFGVALLDPFQFDR
ncbi:MAG: type II toxin-antitoxin system VapC family toxin [Pseudomonas sp.]|uniref:type II toxin-antitoxin system VapC family toxin n=1 Tax=Ottowia sp. TaxID=1898956 RepID=UPI0039E51998